ncbi:flagellar hook-length control protein FliK [Ferrimonas lipolytica]|uniref:Flagellar hook-length control protein-like C-terminal domain-containing protein n=1 Tax=Ferrimonas lipolytica TaxID=2724191 RepID=A0A6H1UD78_9GAMM|nr:flagellar hook-length control protein FliK [Ferrimonas lipolytica]QIZ76798.1 hypothetical protein HER31_07860 [Ferrimonas lipolytica]
MNIVSINSSSPHRDPIAQVDKSDHSAVGTDDYPGNRKVAADDSDSDFTAGVSEPDQACELKASDLADLDLGADLTPQVDNNTEVNQLITFAQMASATDSAQRLPSSSLQRAETALAPLNVERLIQPLLDATSGLVVEQLTKQSITPQPQPISMVQIGASTSVLTAEVVKPTQSGASAFSRTDSAATNSSLPTSESRNTALLSTMPISATQSPTAVASMELITAISQPADAADNTIVNQHSAAKLNGDAANNSQVAKPSWGPLSVSADQLTMGRELQQALGEQLKFQIDQKFRGAQLRLDPPDLGKIDLNVQLDGNRMSVVVTAVNPLVKDALMQQLDRIRTDLELHFDGAIDVSVNDQPHSQQQHSADELIESEPVTVASYHDDDMSNTDPQTSSDLDVTA